MSDTFILPRPGLGNVGSYQVSGIPFVTGTVSVSLTGYTKVSFPYVTKHIYIRHTAGANLNLYFTDPTGSNTNAENRGHYFILSSNGAFDCDVKCKEIYLSGSGVSYYVFAELTNISTDQMFTLTGSGLTD